MTTYYTVSGVPTAHSFGSSAYIRTEYTSIETAFGTVNSEMITKGAIAGQAWAGAHTFTGGSITVPTQTLGNNSTFAASTAFVFDGLALKANIANPTFTGIVTIPSGASIAGYAPLASPALTGVPTAPTAAGGTATTQIATTEFVTSTAFNVNLPGQTGNAGKFVTTNGTSASWAFAGISQVTTATTATTLTNTPTLLQITPASYGVTVTLPDATTCSVGGPLHCIDNRGAYPVLVCDSTGTLKGFIFAGVVSYISLDDNSTAAGVWAISSNELVGASAQLLTTNLAQVNAVIDIGSSREVLLGCGTNNQGYAVVYDRSTNTFGSVTAVRAAIIGNYGLLGVLSAANQVLCVSCGNSAATFEAVTLSISGTTITVNTAATATLSANISAFADGCGLIAVGSSFVTSYRVSTPVNQIRALSISGTTVTIGAATVLSGTTGGLTAASGSVVLVTDNYASGIKVKVFTVTGSSLAAGTDYTNAYGSTAICKKFFPLGSRWCYLWYNSSNQLQGEIISLSGTTATGTTIGVLGTTYADAIVVGTNKVLCLGDTVSSNANILTDTAGTASAGTAITLTGDTSRACLYANGTTVAVVNNTSAPATNRFSIVDCSGASPVLSQQTPSNYGFHTDLYGGFSVSNAVLSRSPKGVYGTAFAQNSGPASTYTSQTSLMRVSGEIVTIVPRPNYGAIGTPYRGKSASETWIADAATVITKLECVA